MDITHKYNTEIYKDEQHVSVFCFFVMSMLLISIYFCVLFFGDVHVAHLYIFLYYVFGDVHVWTSPKNIAQKYIKMSNMADITKKKPKKKYKDEQHGHHKKTKNRNKKR
jgi:hypothetical protein